MNRYTVEYSVQTLKELPLELRKQLIDLTTDYNKFAVKQAKAIGLNPDGFGVCPLTMLEEIVSQRHQEVFPEQYEDDLETQNINKFATLLEGLEEDVAITLLKMLSQ